MFEIEVRSRPRRFLLVGALCVGVGGLIYNVPILHAGPQYWFWVLLTAPGLFLIALSFAGLQGIGNQSSPLRHSGPSAEQAIGSTSITCRSFGPSTRRPLKLGSPFSGAFC